MFVSEDHFTDHLADAIHEDLFEPWREIDAWITSFCPCSLTLSGACSARNRPRAHRSRSRACRRVTLGKSSDPDDPGTSHNIVNLRRAS